jgi:hypothetical protein
LGLTITAAPQLIAQLTQVTLKNALDYSSRFNGCGEQAVETAA